MNIAIAGMGLIGGSLFKAARRAGHAVVGFDRGEAVRLAAAEVVFVALPPEGVVPWIREHADGFAPGSLVVDVCGVKRPVVEGLADLPRRNWTFVGGHPMAGREVSGFANSTPDLFRGASMILTPDDSTPPAAIERLRALFAELGFARTVIATPAHHDEMIAFTSQLGHVIANAYVRDTAVAHAAGYSAGSYANMTRIASMDPLAWSALFLANREALVDKIDGLLERLREFRDRLAAGDRAALERLIAEGARAKAAESSPPPAR